MSEAKAVEKKVINVKQFPSDLWDNFQWAAKKKFGHGGGLKALEQAVKLWMGKNKEFQR